MSVRCGYRALQTSVIRLSEAIAAAPPLDGAPKHYSPKVQQLVNDIASLTLIEVSDLNELLKVGLVWITSDCLGALPSPCPPTMSDCSVLSTASTHEAVSPQSGCPPQSRIEHNGQLLCRLLVPELLV